MKTKLRVGLAILMLTMGACEPVIAIGWKEIFFVIILVAFLFGPPIYRFVRRLDDFRNSKKK